MYIFKKEVQMGKKVKGLLNFVAWLTGVLVSLAVGFAMTGGTLTVPWLPSVVTVVAGWIVVITTLVSVVLAVLKQ
jgi:hypothetical protein